MGSTYLSYTFATLKTNEGSRPCRRKSILFSYSFAPYREKKITE